MNKPLKDYREGEVLPDLLLPALTRHMFALYCGGSGDHNPLHTDLDFAREAGGLPDVIGQGMLSMALAARLITNCIRPEQLRTYSVRFMSMTHVDDVLTCSGSIKERSQNTDGVCLTVDMRLSASDGRTILTGTATIHIG